MSGVAQKIGRYEILARIASGGMAEVFLGRTIGEAGFERLVAVKRILPHLTSNETFVSMFIDEARISSGLQHSNIGQVLEFDRVGETYFIAMEYIQGLPLTRICKLFADRDQVLPPPLAAFLMANVCAALEHAHTRCDSEGNSLGIIHRDVNPKNVMVSFDGGVKLIDFGIARASHRLHDTTGETIKGKFAYMSPEQAYGKPLDNRSDIFSAGVVLFELLTHYNPFETDSDLGTLERVRKAEVSPPTSVVQSLPPELDAICIKALAREVDERYATAGQLQAALEDVCFAAGYGRRRLGQWMHETFAEEIEQNRQLLVKVSKIPPADSDSPGTLSRGAWLALGAAALACVALVVVAVYLWQRPLTIPPEPVAQLSPPPAPEPISEPVSASDETQPTAAPDSAARAAKPDRGPARKQAPLRLRRQALIDVHTRAGGKPVPASVFVDGRKLGASPGKFKIPQGTHIVRAHRAGFAPVDREVTLRPGERRKLVLEFRQ